MMGHQIYRSGSTVLLALQLWETLTGHAPLGGSVPTETMTVLAGCFIVSECAELVKMAFPAFRRAFRHLARRARRFRQKRLTNGKRIAEKSR